MCGVGVWAWEISSVAVWRGGRAPVNIEEGEAEGKRPISRVRVGQGNDFREVQATASVMASQASSHGKFARTIPQALPL